MLQMNHAKAYGYSHPFWIDFVVVAIAIVTATGVAIAVEATVIAVITVNLEVTLVRDSNWMLFEWIIVILAGRKRKEIIAAKKATSKPSAAQLILEHLAMTTKVPIASITATTGYSCYFQTFRIFCFLF